MSSKPKRLERVFWVVLLVAILVHLAVYLLVAYPAMPEMVPIHWSVGDAAGEWSPKWVTIITAALPLPILLLVFLVPRIDPKGRNFDHFRSVYLGVSAAIPLVMAAISWTMPFIALGVMPADRTFVTTLILLCAAMLMIAFGNYLPRVRPNYMLGVQTPWTLASEATWRRTHRFAGPVFMTAGVAMLVVIPFSTIAPTVSFWIAMSALFAAIVVVCAYSYVAWRREGR